MTLPRETVERKRLLAPMGRLGISRLVMVPLFAGVMFTSSRWDEYPLMDGLLFLTGCVGVAIATIGRLWCSLYICGYKSDALVTSGPYSLCRNPLYLFSLIGFVGIGFASERLTLVLIVALLFAAIYPRTIRREEAALEERHGDEFRRYRSGVPRFWPRHFRMIEPEEYVVMPRRFRRNMLDAAWFVWVVGLVELVEAVREAGVLPTVASLY